MPINRRDFIKQSLVASVYTGFAGSLLSSSNAQAAWVAEYFAPATLTDTLKKRYHDAEITESEAITLKLPRVVENGAVVSVTVSSTLPEVSDIALFVAKNPSPLAATFKLSPTMDAIVSTRIKIAATCNVIAVINSAGKLYKARQEVEVTVGGCGG
jgi:sulfur-oxidizing protein SoxY